MNAFVKREAGVPALHMDQTELMAVLRSSLYPGAKDESIKMVVGYCKAAGLDPMLKPVHIVPMDVPTGKKDSEGSDIKEKRDVVMPGIGLYRVQAEESGLHAGTSEPEFGPDKTTKLGDTEITYPEWCRVTVFKIVDGKERAFPARELWIENYAQKGRKKDPNAMWAKRPYAQLAKCAEAQALRKAFPSRAGSQPTAEEMEGKPLVEDVDTITGEVTARIAAPVEPEPPAAYPDDRFAAKLPEWTAVIQSGKQTIDDMIAKLTAKLPLTETQIATLRAVKPVAKQEPDNATADPEFLAAMDKEST